MALINCKNCGGSIALSEDKTFGTCDFCGSTMTFPKVDDEQRAAAFNRGNHFRRIGEFDKALAVYERIVQENEQDAEAHWCCALCRFGIEYVEDPESFEWLPTCHRASFDSFLEDVDYLAAVANSEGLTQRQYRKDAAKIAEVQRGILATSQNTEPYDVFICYKESDADGQRTRDSLMAQDIYYQLTEQGKRVFFARITLEDVAGKEYEPYIFAALNSAKIMVVVGTKPEHFSAVWVKNEWSRFLAMMRKDRSKLLLPCYAGMDPYDLPEQLSVLQSYDMTKIGFIQDLIRGIGKVVEAEKKPEPAAPAAPVAAPVAAPSTYTALLKRGAMALEDGDWKRADEFYEEVLNQDAECGEAYLGKFLAQQQCSTLEAVAERRISMTRKIDNEKSHVKPDLTGVEEFAAAHSVCGFLSASQVVDLFPAAMTILLTAPGWRKVLAEEPKWWSESKLLTRAEKYGTPELKAQITAAKEAALESLRGKLAQAEEKDRNTEDSFRKILETAVAEARDKADKLYQENRSRWEARFHDLSRQIDEADSTHRVEFLKRCLLSLGNDPAVQDEIQRCADKKQELIDQENARKEADEKARLEAVARAKKTKKIVTTVIIATVITAVTVWLLVTNLFAPMYHYNAAQTSLAQGDVMKTLYHLTEAGSYKDAEQLLKEQFETAAVRDTITAGSSHTVAIKSDGTVVAVGSNKNDQCDVDDWSDIVAVAAGSAHTVGLKANGTAIAVGSNSYGQCEVGDWSDIVAIAAGGYHTVGLKADGTVVAVGDNSSSQCDLDDWYGIVAIAAGYNHTVGLKADGSVVAVGANNGSQCDVADWSDIVAIAAGGAHTVGLKADDTVVAVGSNTYGKCDVGDWSDIVAIAAGYNHTVGLKADGTVVAVGATGSGQCDVADWSDIVAISAGYYHTLGLKADGTVVTVGDNRSGQCDVIGWTDIRLPD